MPNIKVTKEDIIIGAVNLVKEEGIKELNARHLAQNLKCSVQPIFFNFKNMEELKKNVLEHIYRIYYNYLLHDINEEQAYKKIGLNYIYFAKEYPHFFNALFSVASPYNLKDYMTQDKSIEHIIDEGTKMTGFSKKEQMLFHEKVWIFTHGLAMLVASKTCKLTNKQIEELLSSTVRQMMIGYKKENI